MQVQKISPTKRPSRAAAAVAIGVAAMLMAACGSSGDVVAVKTDGGGSASGIDEDGLAKAREAVAEMSERPTTISIQEPIAADIPTGKTIAYVHCGVAACNPWADATQSAAEALGWTAKIYYTQGTPEGVQAAWSSVVRDAPDGVVASGWDKNTFANQLAELKAKGIPVMQGTVTDEPGDGIELVINGSKDFAEVGNYMAARAVATTDGAANTLYVNAPDYTILGPATDEFQRAYAEYCSACKLELMNMPATAIGGDATNRIVSHLRAHPDVNVVVNSISGLSLGLPAALNAAGLTDVKIIDNAPTPENYEYIRAGTQDATFYSDARETVWMLVDGIVRIVVGQPVISGEMPGTWLLTQENIPDANDFTNIADYQDQFKKVWGVA